MSWMKPNGQIQPQNAFFATKATARVAIRTMTFDRWVCETLPPVVMNL